MCEQAVLKAFARAKAITRQRYAVYQQLAGITVPLFDTAGQPVPTPAEAKTPPAHTTEPS